MGVMRFIAIATAVIAGLILPRGAFAHSQSYGYLNIAVKSSSLEGTLEVAVRDLDTLLGLDNDGDGKITWGEFRSREPALTTAVLNRISIGTQDGVCDLRGRPALTQSRGGETYQIGRAHV